jgi:hypothetical protein
MNKITPLVLSSFLLLGAVACEDTARTSRNAPASTEETGKVVTDRTIEENKEDATSQVRRDQLDADIRAREERDRLTGGTVNRADSDLASEVRSKLEANIPRGQLTVTAQDGAIVVSGTVPTQEELNKIDSLAKEIRGVKSVQVLAQTAQPVPEQPQ